MRKLLSKFPQMRKLLRRPGFATAKKSSQEWRDTLLQGPTERLWTMAAQEDGQYPRINASMHRSGQYVGKIVSLVGRVEAFDGTTVTLRCADGANVSITADPDFCQPTGTIIEVVGFVNEDNSVQVCSVGWLVVCDGLRYLNATMLTSLLMPSCRCILLLQLFVTRELTPDMDLDLYNRMITQVLSNPKFAQYFQPLAMIQ